jgi:superfamily II DNA/RNA helicase
MDQARQGLVRIIVSSDQLARGIDLASVKLVINYDPPKHPRTYVHRVGRTARANRAGHSITMLKLGHLGEFKKLRKSIDDRYDEVGKSKVAKQAVSDVENSYQYAIKHLSTIIDAEGNGTLRPGSH